MYLEANHPLQLIPNDNIYLRGNGNILILMDGKPTTITALNSIPASGIESIYIVTNPDVKYDAEGTGGIINIVMKRQSVSGMSGAMSLNYGFNNRINGGSNFDFRKGIWDVGFNYNGKYERTKIHSNLTRQLYSQSTIVEQEINSVQITPTQVAGLSMSAKPTEKNIITFGLRLLYPDFNTTQTIYGRQLRDTLPVIIFNRRNEITFSRKVIESTLSYRKILRRTEMKFHLMLLIHERKVQDLLNIT